MRALHQPGLKALHEFGTPLISLHRIVSVEVGKHDDNIYVSAETKDPAEAPIIAKAVVDAYIAYQTKPKESSLDNKLAALRSSRDDAAAVMRQYQRGHGRSGDALRHLLRRRPG